MKTLSLLNIANNGVNTPSGFLQGAQKTGLEFFHSGIPPLKSMARTSVNFFYPVFSL
jgi:hypothetical protein